MTGAHLATPPTPAAVRWLVAVAVGAGLLLAGVATPASAHAQLVSTTPTDRAALDEGPDRVLFSFNEPVTASPGALRVYDGDGQRVDDATQVQVAPDEVAVGLDPVAAGGYVATYLVTSADGHVVRGAVTFTVGAAAAVDDATVAVLFEGTESAALAWLARLVQVVVMAAVLVALGALVVAHGRNHGLGGRLERRAAVDVVRAAATWGIPAALLAVPLQAARTSGAGFAVLGQPDVLATTLTASVGLASMTVVGGLVVAMGSVVAVRPATAATPRPVPRRPVVGALAAVLLTASLAVAGHTRTVEPRWLVVGADLVHVAAAGTWLGGLVVLVRTLRSSRRVADDGASRGPVDAAEPRRPLGDTDPLAAGSAVARFSGRALVAMGAVVAAGGALTWALARQPRTLVSTEWGWTWTVKVVLVAVLVLVAAFNRFRLVPHVADAAERTREAAVARLRGTLRIEAGLAAVVLLATSLLVGLRPAAQEAGITGAFDAVVAVDDDLLVNVVVDPNRAGSNQIHLYLLDASRRPTDAVDEVTVELLQVAEDVGPIVRDPVRAGPGHWIVAGNDLAIPGPWRITAVVAVDRFTELRTDVDVVVNP